MSPAKYALLLYLASSIRSVSIMFDFICCIRIKLELFINIVLPRKLTFTAIFYLESRFGIIKGEY